MLYKGITFRACYLGREATAAEIKLQKKVARRRWLSIVLDAWVRQHADSFFDAATNRTSDFVGWAIESKDGSVLDVVADAHAYIDKLKDSPR